MQTSLKRGIVSSIIIGMVLFSFGCGAQPSPTTTPTATPDVLATSVAATNQANGEATRIAAAVAQALTAAAPTVTQTPTQTPPSTLTSTPTDTATPAPTDTSVPTDTPRPRPINTATRTPVPPVPKNVPVIFDNKWEITVMGFRHADSLYWGSDRYQAFGTFVSFIVRIKNLQPGTDYYANRFTWWVDDGSGTPKRYGTSALPEEAAQYNYCVAFAAPL